MLEELIKSSKAYNITANENSCGRLAHALIIEYGDDATLRTVVKTFAKLILNADKSVDDEQHPDLVIVPPVGEKLTKDFAELLIDESITMPTAGERKVLAIDGMQKMLIKTQNKLLKLIEEPPDNVFLIIGTTNEYMLLPTIRSRAKSVKIQFSTDQITALLKEKYPSLNNARAVAEASCGSIGDAYAFAEGDFDKTEALAFSFASARSMAELLPELNKLSDLPDKGRFINLLQLIFRDAFMLKAGCINSVTLSSKRERLVAIGEFYASSALIAVQKLLYNVEFNLKFNAPFLNEMECAFAKLIEENSKWKK